MVSKNQIKFVRQLEHKKFRSQLGLFVAEGPKVVGDLLAAGLRPHSIFTLAEGRSIVGEAMTGGAPLVEVSPDELCKLSLQQHPQQMLAVFHTPRPTIDAEAWTDWSAAVAEGCHPLGRLLLMLDGVQDPGNVGTIIRLADWFGISTIVCSPDTADAYNPKVVQASMGSIGHVSIVSTPLLPLLDLLPAEFPVYGTLLDGSDIYRQPLTPYGVVVMGNEGNGISPAVRQRVNRRLYIPCFNNSLHTAESLNVAIATAITCSEFCRRSITKLAARES